MTDSIWDDPDLIVNDEYVTFDAVGDTITGTIVNIKKHVFDDGKAVPQILLKTAAGDEKTVTAGQVRLKAALAEIRPGVGQVITITLTEVEKRSGGKTLKHFDVQIGNPAPAPAPAVQAAGIPDDSQLTPEQLAAKRLLGL